MNTRCPVCGNADTVPRIVEAADRFFQTTRLTFSLRACAGCRCLFLDPLPERQDLERFYPAAYWAVDGRPNPLRYFESLYRRVVLRDHVGCVTRAAAGLSPAGGSPRLLDVGCGSGLLLSVLKSRGFDVRGFDSSREARAVAKHLHGVDVVVGESVAKAGFAADEFDVVTLFHVLEHVSDPRQVLSEVRRILQPQGRVLVQVPNIESWQSRLFGGRWYGLDVPRHVVNYSHYAIRKLLGSAGFRIRRTRHFNLRDNAAAVASSLCPSLDPVSRRVRNARHSGESTAMAWIKHAAYAGVLVAAYPLILAESLFNSGGTVTLEAEKA